MRTKLMTTAGLALATATVGLSVSPASAAPDVDADCASGASCDYLGAGLDPHNYQPGMKPSDYPADQNAGLAVTREDGERTKISGFKRNCTGETATFRQGTAATRGTTYSFGLTEDAGVDFADVFRASLSFTEGVDFSETHTESGLQDLPIAPGHVGAIYEVPSFDVTTGRLFVHYGSRNEGHYYWKSGTPSITRTVNTANTSTFPSSEPMTPAQVGECTPGSWAWNNMPHS